MSDEDSPLGRPNCMHESSRSVGNDAAVVTVRSDEYCIASSQAPCFSCARFATVLGLLFPASSTTCRGGEGPPRAVPVSDEIRYFQLIYVRQISAPTLADVVQLHADYDVRLGGRYVMNHCERCGASFSDSKLFESRGVGNSAPHVLIESGASFRARQPIGGCDASDAALRSTIVVGTQLKRGFNTGADRSKRKT
jgi:hypothetical protein